MKWQAADDHAVIAFGNWRAFWHIFDNACLHVFPQQNDDFVAATQIEPAIGTDLIVKPYQEAREEQRVADTLLDAAEHALAINVLALPVWRRKLRIDLLAVLLLPEGNACLVVLPAAPVVAKRKQHHRAAPFGIEIVGIERDRVSE